MQLINVQNIDGELLVTSREISTNFEKEHRNVVRAIENLTVQNCTVKDMFIESTFEHRGNLYKEYLMTRDGFSLLVMGFTGEKALNWKLKYIETFNKMEKQLKDPFKNLSPELRAIFKLDSKHQELENKVMQIENKMTINYELAENIRTNISSKAIEILEGKHSEAYKRCSKKVFTAIHKELKKYFKVNSYKNLSIKKYDEAIDYIRSWYPETNLRLEIEMVNRQVNFN
jgi:anti-repressor protein